MTTPFCYAEKESYLVCVWMILIVFEVLGVFLLVFLSWN